MLCSQQLVIATMAIFVVHLVTIGVGVNAFVIEDLIPTCRTFPCSFHRVEHNDIRWTAALSKTNSFELQATSAVAVVEDTYKGLTASQMGVDKFNRHDKFWIDRYYDLKDYKANHGDCNVPENYTENKSLANWVRNQRTAYRYLMQNDNPDREKTKINRKITQPRIELLEDLGFEWELTGWEETWEQRFEELVEYYEENGNCHVPQNYEGKKRRKQPLGWWVMTQRRHYQLLQEGMESCMTKERIHKLENIGFVWNQLEANWFERFDELKAYKEEHGDCNVPQRWNENIELANWVQTQRAQCRLLREGNESSMTEARIEILEDLGLVWNVQEATWFQRFEELKRYKEKHGDCNVPRGWNENVKLGRWVNKQRSQYRLLQEGETSQMTKERILLLESIGFKWSLNNTRNE